MRETKQESHAMQECKRKGTWGMMERESQNLSDCMVEGSCGFPLGFQGTLPQSMYFHVPTVKYLSALWVFFLKASVLLVFECYFLFSVPGLGLGVAMLHRFRHHWHRARLGVLHLGCQLLLCERGRYLPDVCVHLQPWLQWLSVRNQCALCVSQ